MLIEISFQCHSEDIKPKVAKFSEADKQWFTEKALSKDLDKPLKMNLDEAVRMLTAFDQVEEITFKVR